VFRRLKPVRGPGTGFSGAIGEARALGKLRKLLLVMEKLL